MLKRCDAYFAGEDYVGTRLSLPSADGRFRMTDVVDTRTLIYLLRSVKHVGAVSLREEFGKGSGGSPEWVLFWLIGQLKKAARGSSERIADYARLRGKSLKMSLVRVAWSVRFVDGGCEVGVAARVA